ncbi:MAG: xanthine dehydrogenase family protein subunit M [Rhizobiaceae bacterium]
MQRYAKPETVDDALTLLAGDSWRILAGGTDFYPAQGARPIRDNVLDINGLDELRGIREESGGVTIGGRTTWTDIVRASLPPAFDGLKLAAREVGAIQIQNTGTVAGNLCNASPAADGVPPLLTLDAEIVLRSRRGERRIPLQNFIQGNRRTDRQPDELLVAVHIPSAAAAGRSSFLKLGARRYLVISIAMAAVRLVTDAAGRIEDVAIAVGACSAVAQRLPALEQALFGHVLDESIAAVIEPQHLAPLQPIDDVRGSAAYRHAAAREIVARALLAVAAPAKRVAA